MDLEAAKEEVARRVREALGNYIGNANIPSIRTTLENTVKSVLLSCEREGLLPHREPPEVDVQQDPTDPTRYVITPANDTARWLFEQAQREG